LERPKTRWEDFPFGQEKRGITWWGLDWKEKASDRKGWRLIGYEMGWSSAA